MFKDANAIAKTLGSMELNDVLIELQGKMMDQNATIVDLSDQLHNLNENQDIEKNISLNEDSFIVLNNDTDNLYCPKCWGKDRKLNMIALYKNPTEGSRKGFCPTCLYAH